MRKSFAEIAAVAVFAMAATAMAAPPKDAAVTVNAVVIGICKVNSAPTLTLALDPTSNSPVSATGNISLWCSRGTSYTVSDPSSGSSGTYDTNLIGNDTVTGNTGQQIPFKLTYNTGGTGGGKSAAIGSAVTATVLYNDFRSATTGTYTKSIVMSISP